MAVAREAQALGESGARRTRPSLPRSSSIESVENGMEVMGTVPRGMGHALGVAWLALITRSGDHGLSRSHKLAHRDKALALRL